MLLSVSVSVSVSPFDDDDDIKSNRCLFSKSIKPYFALVIINPQFLTECHLIIMR